MQSAKTLVVIGGGAAGIFCAVNAARLHPRMKVLVLEKSSKILAKVKVSGGGRCNVTHHCFDIAELVKRYPRGQHFLKKAFHWFHPTHTIEWFQQRGVELKTEADGRMFPVTDNSQTIIDCLLREVNTYGVELRMNTAIQQIERYGAEGFRLHTQNGQLILADYICVACGGYPKAEQFHWLTALQHTIEPPVPSLFTFNIPQHPVTALMGVSVEQAIVKINGTKLQEQGPLLITHWGLSGPVVLKLSAWGARTLAEKQYQFAITVNWLPGYHEQSLRDEWGQWRQQLSAQKISGRNPFGLPARLWLYLLEQSGIGTDLRWADLPAKLQNNLIHLLVAQPFNVRGKTTFKEEFVTCGGIRLAEIEVNTMQSRKIPGLFFAGEIMDVDGITGGFNFQHAWTSGWLAAKAIAAKAGQANEQDQ